MSHARLSEVESHPDGLTESCRSFRGVQEGVPAPSCTQSGSSRTSGLKPELLRAGWRPHAFAWPLTVSSSQPSLPLQLHHLPLPVHSPHVFTPPNLGCSLWLPGPPLLLLLKCCTNAFSLAASPGVLTYSHLILIIPSPVSPCPLHLYWKPRGFQAIILHPEQIPGLNSEPKLLHLCFPSLNPLF